jgi:hypothetical protein
MPKSSSLRLRAVDPHVIDFLSELARCLVAAGIKNSRLAGMLRLALFRAASRQAKFGNERLNQSAVAAMTGLTRLQVRQFANQSKSLPPEGRDRIENVIDGWVSDVRFTTVRNQPRRLRTTGRGNTFEKLVQKYGGDLTHRSVLREMQRHGYVTIRDNYVSLKSTITQTRDESRLRRLSLTLAQLLKESVDGEVPLPPLRTINLEVSYPVTSDRGRILLQKRTADGLIDFLARVKAAGVAASVESPPPARQKGRLTRTRVVLLTEDLES